MLRADFHLDIRNLIQATQGFCAEDFHFVEDVQKEAISLTISYRFSDGLAFHVKVPRNTQWGSTAKNGRPDIVGWTRPGVLLAEEPVSFATPSEVLTGLRAWVKRVREELDAIPVNRRLTEQEESLADLASQIEELPDRFFTGEEAAEMKARLDALEEQLTQGIKQQATTRDEQEAKIAEIHADIDSLRQAVDALKQRGWAGAFKVRLAKWLADPTNQSLLVSSGKVASKILLSPGSEKPEAV